MIETSSCFNVANDLPKVSTICEHIASGSCLALDGEVMHRWMALIVPFPVLPGDYSLSGLN